MIDLTIIADANNLYGTRLWNYYYSPGRVNLIGEHLDYNGGFVLPCSLNLGISGLISIREDTMVNCYSEVFKDAGIITFNIHNYTQENNWVDYVKAVISEVNIKSGFDLYINSNLPDGAGLSSSASLELLILEMLNIEFKLGLSRLDIIKKAKHAENEYLGVKCGIMDQFVIGMGKEHQAILLNTATLDYSYVNCDFNDYQLIIANTNKKRSLANSQYNKRREECQQALLEIDSTANFLCELTLDDFNIHLDKIANSILIRRAHHVISENERSIKAKVYLENNAMEAFGELMYLSHKSLKDDYEVSCYELDSLVELFKNEGAIGARMTGAGFGGCIVALIDKYNLDEKLANIEAKYYALTSLHCCFYLVEAGSCTRKIFFDINRYLSQLLHYGLAHNILDNNDFTYAVNSLIHKFNLHKFEYQDYQDDNLDNILDAICNYQILKGQLEDNITLIDNFKAEVIDLLMDKPSTVNHNFWYRYKESSKSATDYLYKLSKDVNYVQVKRISKNINWDYFGKYGQLLLTINLSKPEKDPHTISKAMDNDYPKCQLCKENIGFYGNINQDSRRNLRAVKINLNNEDFYFQYSPYAYYNEHAIVFNKYHKPMVINKNTFTNLVAFIDLFPHYFVGSNADLPIVGGSILNHDHYQAGNFKMPIEDAEQKLIRKIGNVYLYQLLWPLSTIRLITSDKDELIIIANEILQKWQGYENKQLLIINGETLHNTLTPILRFKNDLWVMDLILRNNYTNDTYPLGVFHPHDNLHHIKKENIGLIEAMGLAILPPRLAKELNKIEMLLLGNQELIKDNDLIKHLSWISYLQNNKNTINIKHFLYQETGKIFEQVLEDCGVFKADEVGQLAFLGFINSI